MRPFELDDLVHLEEMFLEMGREEGKSDGLRAGRPEGFTLGLEKGFDMLTEVAYYESCAQLWLDLVTAGVANASQPLPSSASTASIAAEDADDEELVASASPQASRRRQAFPDRAAKSLSSFLILVRSFPHHNALDTGILELLERIRGKWKLVCAVTGVPMSLASYGQGNAWTEIAAAAESGSTESASLSSRATSPSAASGGTDVAGSGRPTNALGAKVSVSQSLSF
ncbi:hypothetical protein BCR44DRAFT_120254 [Catenaria anguillulae PL171]|uniref:Uncharacterized protein n=1 Tax=Catenaria anguillulae PL171 TaxID=765915 RepID=A0A1Y2I0B1_9FUNG|nr:hypothetical protein BCR44DRAFT_120254 [Catenaria anguillulae PL171]